MEFQDGGGIFEVAELALAAVILDGAELFERFVELFREAMAVHAEGGDGFVGVHDVESDRGFFSRRVGGAGEEVGFEERNAIESPGGVGDFLDELGFCGSFRLVLVAELLAMILISGEVFGGEEGGAAGEAMSESVECRTLFAGFGSRAGGMLSIFAIDGGAENGHGGTGLHHELLRRLDSTGAGRMGGSGLWRLLMGKGRLAWGRW